MEIEYVWNYSDVHSCLDSAYNDLIGHWSIETLAETFISMTQMTKYNVTENGHAKFAMYEFIIISFIYPVKKLFVKPFLKDNA